MKMIKMLSMLFVLLTGFSMTCPAKEWNGIVPLATTRLEVTARFGTPLIDKETEKEYFTVGDDRVEITWTRSDCYDEKKMLITGGDIPQDALVYQVTVLPKLPNELSSDVQKLIEADGDESEPSVSVRKELRTTYKKWVESDVHCLGPGEPNGTLSCTTVRSTVGFGYSSAEGGVKAMYFFPSNKEEGKWKATHSQCLSEDRQIDEFGLWESEEFEARLDNVIIEQSKRPSENVQFLISRAEKDPPGLPYRLAASIRAYLRYRKAPEEKFIFTICDVKSEALVQVWLLTSGQMKTCHLDETQFTETTKFDTAYYPENPFGSCCISDSFGLVQAEASLRAFAGLMKKYPESKAYLFVYAGSWVYKADDVGDSVKAEMIGDERSNVKRFKRKALKILVDAGVESSRINIKYAGHNDDIGKVDLWIVPVGGEIPKPDPTYFPNGD